MSLRLEMLQVARLSTRLLSDGSDLVRAFVGGRLNPDGGFADRAGNSDLYYTVFGLNCMLALEMGPPVAKIRDFIEGFGAGAELDLIHLCALARCWSNLGLRAPRELLGFVEAYRTPNGGYRARQGADRGDPYGNFMALGAYQDLGLQVPDPAELVEGCLAFQARDGGFANEPELAMGNTPATAAAEPSRCASTA